MITYVIAFFGGMFGTMIGGGPAFVVCGLIGIAGLAAGAAGNTYFAFTVALGPLLIPCVAYISGLVALQYANKRGYIDNNKDVGVPLMSLKKPDVLIVGGIVGVLCMLMKTGFDTIGLAAMCDTGGLVVLVMSIIAKFIFFPKNLLGKVPADVKKLKGGRFSPKAAAGLPNCETGFMRLVIGLGVGGSSAALSYLFVNSGNKTLASMAVVAGFLFYTGMMSVGIPPYFGAALVAGYAFVFSGNSFLWGIVGGVITIFISDALVRCFNLYSDGNIECVAGGLVFPSIIVILIFPKLGLYTAAPIVQYIAVAAMALLLIVFSVIDEKRLKLSVIDKEELTLSE